ncbi:MAG TPA: tannase/feruloyl esterase family alpha/beta hydrolase [Candidatus Sulfotelmatobacter sp.]|nr:tannase/feruloyl esterase family alpha/beta hydrolase [Candidatus Sulfotelmatobacter sp.]
MKAHLAYRLVLVALLLATSAVSAENTCDRLMGLKVPGATIILAQTVAAGTFAGPAMPPYTDRDLTTPYKNVPAFCRVVAVAKPVPDSEIRIEVWMPASGWNGKLQGLGNGGFAGRIDYMPLGVAVSKGYAVTATNTGHDRESPLDASWALGHPEKVIDFGHRGIHEMTRVAKETVRAFYGKPPQHSYFAGCSDGGREALMEAQRYPADYDGILAGAPANYWTALLSTAAADTQALTLDAASYIPQAKVPAIAAAVMKACDELDGVRDGILNDPRQCHFDPATIQCKAGEDTEQCLTAPQVTALKKIYAGPHDAHGQQVFPGFLPGGEDGPGGWGLWIFGPAPAKSLMAFFGVGYFADMVYETPDWDYKTFRLEAALKLAEERTASALNATDADLKPFQARGGKLILYHGWNDPAIPALNTVNYYQSVLAKMGGDADSFVRLYMVPGMQHCDSGPGPDSFGQVGQLTFEDPQHSVDAALERWVEKGEAPGTIIASKYSADDRQHPKMTRPLCAYPQAAKYKGKSDANDAASFVCEGKK